MKKRLKAAASIVLAACMLLTAFPVSAAEADGKAAANSPGASVSDDMQISSTNSFGSMIADELSEEQEKQEENNGVNVISVEVEDQNATAQFSTTCDSTLVIGIYSEDESEMYTSAKTNIGKDDTTAELTFDIETMPQYFFIKAYIVDTETLKPLCTVYDCPNYTQEMQEFFAKTTDDFDEERVLNLDDDETNNFAVYNDDVVMIETTDNSNIITSADDETKTYVIENADETVLSLTAGQVFSCRDGNSITIAKVSSVSANGTTATIQGEDIDLGDAFDYVRIEDTSDLSDAEYDTSEMDSNIKLIDDGEDEEEETENIENPKTPDPVGKSGELSEKKKKKFTFPDEEVGSDWEINGEMTLEVKAKAKVYHTVRRKYIEININYTLDGNVSFDIEKSKDFDFELFKIRFIPAGNPAIGIVIKISPELVLSASGHISLHCNLKGSIGFTATKKDGIKKSISKPKFTAEFNAEAKLYMGVRLRATVAAELNPLDPDEDHHIDLVAASAWGESGIEAAAKYDKTVSINTKKNTKYKHDCKNCIAGEIIAKIKLGVNVQFLSNGDDCWKEFSKEFDIKDIKLTDFYYSITYKEFDWTTCPHKRYRLKVTAVDSLYRPVKGVTLTVIKASYDEGNPTVATGKTNKNGNKTFYLPDSGYVIFGEKDGVRSPSVITEIKGNTTEATVELSVGKGSDVIDVCAAFHQCAALTRDGTLYMWGDNGDGRLGIGSRKESNCTEPRKINGGLGELPENSVRQISLGGGHCAALTFNGRLYTWGGNNYGQLGNGSTLASTYPVHVLKDMRFKYVAAGTYHTAVIDIYDNLYIWGSNQFGQLGDGTKTNSSVPVPLTSLGKVKSVSIGFRSSAAVTEGGDLYVWGSNYYGEIGLGNQTETLVPTKLLDNVKSVCIDKDGGSHSAAVKNDGTVYCWGFNPTGQVGIGEGNFSDDSYRYQRTPQKIRIKDDIRSANIGYQHSTAISEDNVFYTWGCNTSGQLGNGNTNNQGSPQMIRTGVAKSDGGYTHTILLTTDGKVMTSGGNFCGQLGNGTTDNSSFFREVDICDHTPASVSSTGAKAGESVGEGETESTPKTAEFKGYKPGAVYNFYSLKNKEIGISDDNLLYITQLTADENGTVSLTYTGSGACSDPYEFLTSLEATDVSELTAEGTLYSYNGSEQHFEPVIKNGDCELTEGVDYTLSGVRLAENSGEYTAELKGRGDYTGTRELSFLISRTGDVNFDGVININDVTAIQRHLSMLDTLTEEKLPAADSNGSGTVDVADATLLQKYIAKYSVTLAE